VCEDLEDEVLQLKEVIWERLKSERASRPSRSITRKRCRAPWISPTLAKMKCAESF
jgi:hypothetical protein